MSRRRTPTNDFICNSCNYRLCTIGEYLSATPKQRIQWSKNWSAHKKSEKHLLNSSKVENYRLLNNNEWASAKSTLLKALNDRYLIWLNSILKTSYLKLNILNSNETLLFFLTTYDSNAFSQFDEGGKNQNEIFIEFKRKMFLIKKFLDNIYGEGKYYITYKFQKLVKIEDIIVIEIDK